MPNQSAGCIETNLPRASHLGTPAHLGTHPALVGVPSHGTCTCFSAWGLQHSPPLLDKDLSVRAGDIMRVESCPTNIPKTSKSASKTEPCLLGKCAPKPSASSLPLTLGSRFPLALPTVPVSLARAPGRPISGRFHTGCTSQDVCTVTVDHVLSSRSVTSLEDLVSWVRSKAGTSTVPVLCSRPC